MPVARPSARCATVLGVLFASSVFAPHAAPLDRPNTRGAGGSGPTAITVVRSRPAPIAPAAFGILAWRSIGPNRGGRSLAAAGSTARPLEYYFGAVGGGLWKTGDGGVTWAPVTDGQIHSSSVGAVEVSESNPDTVYLGMGEVQLRGNVMQGDGVYKSTDAGRTWTHVGLADTQAIGRVRIHPTNPDVVYVAALGHTYGPNDERGVFRTRDGGKTWQNVTPKDMPEFTRVSIIDASPHEPGGAYMAGKRYQLDDRAPYIWKTSDFGQTWTKVVAGIASGDYVHVVREDTRRRGLLYAGTEHGVYVSFDDGANWQSLSLNLPDTQVADLVVEEHDLVIGTHGRSFYILDDIDFLRQLTPAVAAEPFHLFEPREAVRRLKPAVFDVHTTSAGANASAEVLDEGGRLVRKLSLPGGARPGLNRVTWDLRYPGATVFPGMILRSAQPARGPLAPPGRYRVRVTIDGQVQTRAFSVVRNPRVTNVTDADLAEQFALAMKIRDATSEANEAVIRIRDLKRQVDARLAKVTDERVTTAARDLVRALSGVEEELYQVRNQSPKDPLNYPVKLNNRIPALLRVVESAEARPTDQSYEVFKLLSEELAGCLARLQSALKAGLVQLNERLAEHGLAPVGVAAR